MTGFFTGNLQDGIALAVREAKAVVCFVRGQTFSHLQSTATYLTIICAIDDTQTSSTWEGEYLKDENV